MIKYIRKNILEENTMAKKKLAAGGLTTKHWLGYMFGDFAGVQIRMEHYSRDSRQNGCKKVRYNG